MSANKALFSDGERAILEQIAATRTDIEGQRAEALAAVSSGKTQAEAAAASGLTEGQVSYIVRRFRDQGLAAFQSAGIETAEPSGPSMSEDEQLQSLNETLDRRVAQLEQMAGMQSETGEEASYSPVGLLTMVRQNVRKLAPDVQIDILRNFQDMSAEDLRDLDTWKGLAYMMAYSARFQAGQVRGKMSETINRAVPEPVQPGRLWQLSKSGINRITPDIARQIFSTFQGATREDLMDPDTWKGVWYMINYSLQFQAEQLKQRLIAAEEAQAQSQEGR